MTKKQLGLASIVALVSLIIGQYSHYLIANNKTTPSVISAFNFPDTTGKVRNSTEWRDKIIVINFWATWCVTCRTEIPVFIQLQRDYANKNVQFIGIAIDETDAVVFDYLKTISINYPILLGGDKAMLLSKQLGNHNQIIPYTVIINSQGNIVHRQQGELNTETFINVFNNL